MSHNPGYRIFHFSKKWLALIALIPLLLFAAKGIPELTGPVVDQAGLLADSDRAALEQMLLKLDASKKAQMAIFITSSLEDEDIESYSMSVAEKWKLGTKGNDQGLLLVVAPNEHRMRLEVGYGLEGQITDVDSRRILDDGLRPYFKQGNYAAGLMYTVQEVARRLGVDLGSQIVAPPAEEPQGHLSAGAFLILLVFLFLVFLSSNVSRFGGGGWGGGGWGGGGFGGGSFGGGGGFSGGGGGFGGGGASSSW